MTIDTIKKQMFQDTEELKVLGEDHFCGCDWFQLTKEEMFVFNLKTRDMPLLVTIFALYMDAKNIAHGDYHDTEIARFLQNTLDYLPDNKTSSYKEFIKFAEIFGVEERKAYAYFYKYDFWEERNIVGSGDPSEPMDLPF